MSTFNYFNCLHPLLEALSWRGSPRRLFETAPYLKEQFALIDLRNMMVELGYLSTQEEIRLRDIEHDHLPCVFVSSQEKEVLVIHHKTENGFVVTDCKAEHQIEIPFDTRLRGQGTFFYEHEAVVKNTVPRPWLYELKDRFKPFLPSLLAWSFFTTCFGILLPLFVRSIYDHVIPTESNQTLLFLTIGLIMGLMVMYLVDHKKEKAVSYIGARIDMLVGTEVMKKLLSLPPSYSEGSSVASQVVQLKQFDSVREIFTGPFFQVCIDAPFLLLYIAVLGMIAGPIAFVPLGVIVCYIVLGIYLYPRLRRSTRGMTNTSQAKRSFLIEAMSNLRTIKILGAEHVWGTRFKAKCTENATAHKKHELLTAFISNTSQTLIKISGIVAIVWGAVRVMNNDMTVGSLMAVVMLIWRALTPIQTLFMFLGRADTILSSMSQLNRFMTMPSERKRLSESTLKFQGGIRVLNAGFRYGAEPVPALQGVTLEARPGEAIAIIGQNGSGKTTLIKLLLGFYQPQAGHISIDGIDLRQLDPVQLRQAIAYVPHQAQFFHGTIAQNLRLCAPEASDDQITKALEKAGLSEELPQLPQGIHTPLTDDIIHRFSSGFLQKVSLARAYVRKSNIFILDEPGNNLDSHSTVLLHEIIKEMKGEKTVLIVTHRPSLIQLSDKILSLHDGQMRMFGPTPKVLEILAGNPQ